MDVRSCACAVLVLLAQAAAASGQPIRTVAGGGPDNMLALGANLTPTAIAADAAGNHYVASPFTHRVFRIDGSGMLTVFAGSGLQGSSGDNGPARYAQLSMPTGVAVDPAGNVYIADTDNNRIRRVDAATGTITTVPGTIAGPGAVGVFRPRGIAADRAGNLYVADATHRVQRIDAATGALTTVAGTGVGGFGGDGGPATSASLLVPRGVALDAAGNLYIADSSNHRIRRVAAGTGIITTVAGIGVAGFSGDLGPARSARLANPFAVTVDSTGSLFIADTGNRRVRRVTPSGIIHTYAGSGASGIGGDGGRAIDAKLTTVAGVFVDGSGDLFIADQSNGDVRRVAAATGLISAYAGNGRPHYSGDGHLPLSAAFNNPLGVALDGAGRLIVADTDNHRVRRVDSDGAIRTMAGYGVAGFDGDNTVAEFVKVNTPVGVSVDAGGNVLIADQSNHRIRRVSASEGVITTIAGTGVPGFSGDGGPATSARLLLPTHAIADAAGNIYIADQSNHRIRRVDAATGVITTVVGSGQFGFNGDGIPATEAHLATPWALALGADGTLHIADTGNDRVRAATFDTTPPPPPTLEAAPPVLTNGTRATFAFSNAEPGVEFLCRLDGGALAACTSPAEYGPLSEGVHTFAVVARDAAGNESEAALHTWTVDVTPPVITIAAPGNGGTYLLNDSVQVSYACTDPAGVRTCEGPLADGERLDTTAVGRRTFEVTASDMAGNTASATVHYDVIYDFSGFFRPLDNPPAWNVVNAGRAVPVKWSLAGNHGLDVLASGSPVSQPVRCGSGDPFGAPVPASAAGRSGLTYDPVTDQYTFVWNTETAWKESCRRLAITLNDGTTHIATFRFR